MEAPTLDSVCVMVRTLGTCAAAGTMPTWGYIGVSRVMESVPPAAPGMPPWTPPPHARNVPSL